jgi:hypothetical protein
MLVAFNAFASPSAWFLQVFGRLRRLMANTILNNQQFFIQGDGASLTAVLNLGFSPTSITTVSANVLATGADVSSNVASTVLTGSTVTFNFTAAFSTLIMLVLNANGVTGTTSCNLTSGVYNSTAPTLSGGQYTAVQSDSTGAHYVNTEGRKSSYHMAKGFFTPVASATSPTFSIQGSATKTVRITHIRVTWACVTGTTTTNDISLQKFSVLSGGTTGSTPVGAKNDSANAAQTAVCLQYSALPSTATVIGGPYRQERQCWLTASATVGTIQSIDWTFGNLNEQGLVLRGIAEYFGIVVAGVGTTPVMDIWIEWTEE